MESIIKVTATPREMEQMFLTNRLNIRSYRWSMDNGFSPDVMTEEQWEQEKDTPYLYEIRLRHCEYATALRNEYSTFGHLISALNKRNARYTRELIKQRERRGQTNED